MTRFTWNFLTHSFLILAFVAAPSPTGAPTVNQFCIEFDFGGTVDPNEPNILEVARGDPELGIIVSLFEATDLDAIFDCPGKTCVWMLVSSPDTTTICSSNA